MTSLSLSLQLFLSFFSLCISSEFPSHHDNQNENPTIRSIFSSPTPHHHRHHRRHIITITEGNTNPLFLPLCYSYLGLAFWCRKGPPLFFTPLYIYMFIYFPPILASPVCWQSLMTVVKISSLSTWNQIINIPFCQANKYITKVKKIWPITDSTHTLTNISTIIQIPPNSEPINCNILYRFHNFREPFNWMS